MKALLQRVKSASVTVNSEVVGEIGHGLVVFVGVAQGDTEKDMNYLTEKIVNLRIFTDENDKFNLSVLDVEGELLVISQFTLLADTRKGRRPNFIEAASPQEAEALFIQIVDKLCSYNLKVETGRFQQKMLVQISNDGPVTIMIDSKDKIG